MSIAVQALQQTLSAWKRGEEVIDSIQHGDYVMSQLVCAINSTLYFYDENATYAFTVEKDTANGNPADIVSFVTTSPAFLPPDSPFLKGPHNMTVNPQSPAPPSAGLKFYFGTKKTKSGKRSGKRKIRCQNVFRSLFM
jgi:hypothetical protein